MECVPVPEYIGLGDGVVGDIGVPLVELTLWNNGLAGGDVELLHGFR